MKNNVKEVGMGQNEERENKSLDSYHSEYPLDYYEIGVPYMFYSARPTAEGTGFERLGRPASNEEVVDFKTVFAEYVACLEDDIRKKKNFPFADRVIGVVIAKETIDAKKGTGYLDVLFQAVLNESVDYTVKRFIAGYSGVFCDDKEEVIVAPFIDLTPQNNDAGADSSAE